MSLKESKLLRKRISKGQRMLIIGIITTFTSQFYLATWENGFRVSAAAILYPIFLMTLMKNSRTPNTGLFTGLFVMIVRVIFDLMAGMELGAAVLLEYPGGIFYFCYDFLFCLMIRDRHTIHYPQLFLSCCACDVLSNIVNLLLSGGSFSFLNSLSLFSLLGVATARAGTSFLILWAGYFYQQLLQRQEHEQRYQRLFLMTAELKNELYFLKKDSEDIEGVMARAYRLYEHLSTLDIPEEDRALALSIAREVHEIKKDNLRIIRGIEGEVADVYDQEEMLISDLFHILEDSTRRLLGEQHSNIRLDCWYEDNIKIIEHYRILSVIKNLVTNAVEAIQSDRGRGTVRVEEFVKRGHLHLVVIDNGPGISPRAMKNLFHVGYSTKFDPNTGNISRGVGLPAVKFNVDELGGNIHVESKPGKGARFTVTFPLEAIQEESK